VWGKIHLHPKQAAERTQHIDKLLHLARVKAKQADIV
jgi:hypothetical protein